MYGAEYEKKVKEAIEVFCKKLDVIAHHYLNMRAPTLTELQKQDVVLTLGIEFPKWLEQHVREHDGALIVKECIEKMREIVKKTLESINYED